MGRGEPFPRPPVSQDVNRALALASTVFLTLVAAYTGAQVGEEDASEPVLSAAIPLVHVIRFTS